MAFKGQVGTSMTTHRLRKPKSEWYSEDVVDRMLAKAKKKKRKKLKLKQAKANYKRNLK